MKNANTLSARLLLALIFACGAAAVCAAQGVPSVEKVEPPSWWVGHSINPVRVLIRGKNLGGARVEAVGQGIKTGLVRINERGTYLFVDVSIEPEARPGVRQLRIRSGGGAVDASFEINAPLPRQGRFQGFSPDDVIYLIMPDRFSDGDPTNNDPPQSRGLYDRSNKFYYHGGDFQGIINHLSYLKDLGVTAIWLTPWYDNVNHPDEIEKKEGGTTTGFHGYGAVDFYGVEEHFGTLAKLRELVDDAHRSGIKVIEDEVRNHTGPYHPWVDDSPTPTWYNGTRANHLKNVFQTWMLHDPYAEEKSKRETMEGWFLDFLPDLNQHDEEARRYLIQNTLWWIGATGIDGIREDTWQYVPNDFWRDWTAAIKREYPNFRVFGEVKDGDPVHVSFYQGGVKRFDGVDSGLDSLLDFPLFYPARRAFGEGQSIREVAQALSKDYLYTNPGLLVTLVGGHDDGRFMSEKGASIAGAKLAHTFILTTRGVPQLYYGDEIGMTGPDEPTTRRDFPGGFAGDARNAFNRQGRTPEEQELFDYIRRVVHLHTELEPLRRGALKDLYVADQQYAYARTTPSVSAVVVINNDAKPASFAFRVDGLGLDNARLHDQLGTVKSDVLTSNGVLALVLPPRSAVILTEQYAYGQHVLY
ncbi:MAG TPA: alpha-amylase family glycosyl hydrolase [Pyrinomonadaceae bacterium]|jgi:glycosidase|nr:alpha-amylase family glycosyl hydrolase [Pyrinomonadaceae bacterium]